GLEQNNGTATVDVWTASYLRVESGRPTVLHWLVNNATSVSIDHGVGSQSDLVSGSVPVNPTPTTTYTITVNGTVTAAVTVPVPTGAGVYCREGAPAATYPHGYATDGSGHVIIETFEPHNFATGDVIVMAGFATTDSGNAYRHASNLNGKFVVADIIDQGHF